MSATTPLFPADFVFGAATSAYQIEGAAFEDGKGPSVWDVFCRQPGAVRRGERGDVACDHYHRVDDDIALMREIGLQAYRFSVSWPRVIPAGAGAVNPAGIAFYDRMVDGLLEAGIEPCVTLFHWDYPHALFHRGGWLNPDSPRWFADYADTVTRTLGDRVSWWITLNEPQVFVDAGHREGRHAPGLRLARADVLLACHHALLAHGHGVQVVRNNVRDSRVGVAPVVLTSMPATDSPGDTDAARRHMFRATPETLRTNTWWLDPMLLGSYPDSGLAAYRGDVPPIADGDMAIICQPLDFLGANIYDAVTVARGADGAPDVVPPPAGAPTTAIGWPVTPRALYHGPRSLHERYRLPIVITENGLSSLDQVGLDGSVRDAGRVDFIARHLRELARAVADGVPVRGYFHWSLLDNFEWARGFRQRFGLVHVDFSTRVRTLKDSASFYRRIIETRGGVLADDFGS